MHRTFTRSSAFTIIELLAVVGIIAVLMAIVIPMIGRARDLGKSTQCLSNCRQQGLAATAFANDHLGYFQPDSNDDSAGHTTNSWVTAADPNHTRWAYYPSSVASNKCAKDYASALIPYLGGNNTDCIGDIQSLLQFTSGLNNGVLLSNWVKAWRCPSDTWLSDSQPGYRIYNDVQNYAGPYYPISYGVNADICSLVGPANIPGASAAPGYGRINGYPTDANPQTLFVAGGPPPGIPPVVNSNGGLPMNCRRSNVANPASTLLFGDCGTRPNIMGTPSNPLDYNDALYFTTNSTMSSYTLPYAKTLDCVNKCSWLGNRLPYNGNAFVNSAARHYDAINVAFVDGHGETVHRTQFANVLISPW